MGIFFPGGFFGRLCPPLRPAMLSAAGSGLPSVQKGGLLQLYLHDVVLPPYAACQASYLDWQWTVSGWGPILSRFGGVPAVSSAWWEATIHRHRSWSGLWLLSPPVWLLGPFLLAGPRAVENHVRRAGRAAGVRAQRRSRGG